MTHRILVLGGAASGKSAHAESLLEDEPDVEYVATAREDAEDAEWSARIAAHRARRPRHWTTIEGGDVVTVLRSPGPAVLVDSITTWLSAGGAARVDELSEAWTACTRTIVAVSDEVGNGVVPVTEAGRRFRDDLGRLNQRLAATASEVHLVVAGLPLRLK